MADDDDRDDDDRDRDQRGSRGKARGRGGDGRQKNEARTIDLAQNPDYIWRLLNMMLSTLAEGLGQKGYEISFIRAGLRSIRAVIGPQLTTLALNATAALIQNPPIVKAFVRNTLGLPDEVNGIIDEFIDELFSGLHIGLSKDHATLNDRGWNEDKVKQELRNRLLKLPTVQSLDEMLGTMPESDVRKFHAFVQQLNDEQRKLFDTFYRAKVGSTIVGLRGFLRILLQPTDQTFVAEGLKYLDSVYGKPAPKADAVNVIEAGVRSLKTFHGKVEHALRVPDPANDPVADMLEERVKKAKRRRYV